MEVFLTSFLLFPHKIGGGQPHGVKSESYFLTDAKV